jgi:organic hydroperoxide reductase OsmC/OhrA
VVVRAAEMVERVEPLHEQAHRMCFLARSVSFPVRHEPRTTVG